MSDNKDIRGSQDRNRISTSEDYEMYYWSDKFGVSKEELQTAIEESGSNDPDEVERYLNGNQ